jgi:ATP-binding cassette, subfamily B, bacterial
MKYTASSIIKRIFFQARPYWMHILGIFVFNFLASPITLMKPLALKILIDSGFNSQPVPGFVRFFFPNGFEFSFSSIVLIAAGLVLLVALIENIYVVVIWMLNTYTGEKLVRNFRSLLFDHMQRLSLAYHDRKGTADAVYRIQYDTSSIRTLIINNLSPIISSVVVLTGMIVVMFVINWRFALITCAIIPPMIFLTKLSSRRLKKDWKKVKEYESSAMSVVQEVLTSLRVVKAFGQEDGETERFTNKANKAMKGQLRVAWVGALFSFGIGMIYATATALFIYFGATYVQSGAMTLGELTMVIAYLSQIYGPLDKISKNLNEIQSSLTSMERVYIMLDEQKEVVESPYAEHFPRATGTIEFQNVSFSYSGQQQILKDVSFQLKPGDRVGLIGSTGAGKSTLINLITRFYDASAGAILVDHKDIRNYKLKDYRNQFGIVLQEPILFSTTIAENIAYGCPNASIREIIEASKMANAHDFIMSLPEGYDTVLGERGMTLSGGERQRISIARAFIKNAPILILDEPTSSLDIRTESQIMEAIERLMAGRTSFLITHRLDTLQHCNVLLHLEKGRLVEFIENDSPEIMVNKKKSFLTGSTTNLN